MDFLVGDKEARYLFFFGSSSRHLRRQAEVTLYLCREEPPKSYHYERLENINSPNVPGIVEIGYHAKKECFVSRGKAGRPKMDKIEKIGRNFFEEVKSLHFQA